ncbi:single-stranded-DNA-specific exonuclease RecJ [Campylobacter sp. FMV-PI01]|uniref:Single-stranded-DNA-specific exonuclease RecJ n=1 Tax=Campylobacter portucalensis TaxID=2608384 RepID=A0A6L5WK64_9BACT|nr:single-stranded-DNA-specific exonuclease RecJ [Campylobacter portucalensis]MSN96243.1 single-stranded-DNA-specific exonuclease RecJ [Campylobacter portucalensis]
MLGKKDVRELLESRFKNDIHKKISEIPLPNTLKDAYKAAYRIKTAIENNEKMAIVGDYDVDGVVSSVILSNFFKLLGANFIVKIPNRFTDGYGLNINILEELKGVNLIITVDNGISATEAAEICLKKGIDLIITDHHMPPPILPKAYAIVNPKQKDCNFPNVEICGAEVAWYLVGALKDICKIKYDMGLDLDLLVIAIIADMMELRDLNRVLLKAGIKKLNLSKRPCFNAIKNYYGKDKFEFDDISFMIAPLINSTGRMEDASISFKFLCSSNLNEANFYLEKILEINQNRKNEEKILYENSLLKIKDDDEIIVAWGKDWHEGVIGIVASRLCKQYKKPAIVFSVDECRAKGSARSVGKFDILKLIASQKDILISFGGHKGAAGIVIDPVNLKLFQKEINKNSYIKDLNTSYYGDEILGEINLNELDMEMLEILEYFEPFGQKNPKPIFSVTNAFVRDVKVIGKDENHIKISVEKSGVIREALFFNYDFKPKIGDFVDFIAHISKNIFRGNISAEFVIREMNLSKK